jgi:hypothetical protein
MLMLSTGFQRFANVWADRLLTRDSDPSRDREGAVSLKYEAAFAKRCTKLAGLPFPFGESLREYDGRGRGNHEGCERCRSHSHPRAGGTR